MLPQIVNTAILSDTHVTIVSILVLLRYGMGSAVVVSSLWNHSLYEHARQSVHIRWVHVARGR